METITTGDGLKLHVRRWPADARRHGTVFIVHGLGEHIGRYADVAAALNAAGWDVVGHDQRGHGPSGGARGSIASQASYLEDLAQLLDNTPSSGARVLLGHSLGGAIAARFAAERAASDPAPWSRPLDALVLSSPALDPGMNGAQKLLLALTEKLLPDLRVGNGLDPAWISRSAEVVAAYQSDPLVHSRVTPRVVRFILDGAEAVFAAAPRWPLPTLLMWAGADRCVAPAGSARFASLAAPAQLTAREWPGLAHEIFNEPEREQVLATLTTWLARL
jgi:alpha-beta hydrolase superfamily lysophospholipase